MRVLSLAQPGQSDDDPGVNPVSLAMELKNQVNHLAFAPPVTHVYNPLDYAWEPHRTYLETYGSRPKRVLFLGMNPGPWGMAQTGIPFGEITAVRDWMHVEGPVGRPPHEHPKRKIEGFDCRKSEVSGRRLWGLFAAKFATADAFFMDHFVANFCPLVFMSASGANITPDKLPGSETAPLLEACNNHLRGLLEWFRPEWAVGVGSYAAANLEECASVLPGLKIGRILHPSPASPAANRDWAGVATRQLRELGVWPGDFPSHQSGAIQR